MRKDREERMTGEVMKKYLLPREATGKCNDLRLRYGKEARDKEKRRIVWKWWHLLRGLNSRGNPYRPSR